MNALNENHYRHWCMHACIGRYIYVHMCFCWTASLPKYTVECSPQVELYKLVESILLGSYYQESTQFAMFVQLISIHVCGSNCIYKNYIIYVANS